MTKTIKELQSEMDDAEAACKAAKLAWRTAEGVAHIATFAYINELKAQKM